LQQSSSTLVLSGEGSEAIAPTNVIFSSSLALTGEGNEPLQED
jgi:hypothetical protein